MTKSTSPRLYYLENKTVEVHLANVRGKANNLIIFEKREKTEFVDEVRLVGQGYFTHAHNPRVRRLKDSVYPLNVLVVRYNEGMPTLHGVLRKGREALGSVEVLVDNVALASERNWTEMGYLGKK
ncbi:MAG: hypothetical protein AABX11_05530 [Nanoarchaeota archaeon]